MMLANLHQLEGKRLEEIQKKKTLAARSQHKYIYIFIYIYIYTDHLPTDSPCVHTSNAMCMYIFHATNIPITSSSPCLSILIEHISNASSIYIYIHLGKAFACMRVVMCSPLPTGLVLK